MKMSALRPFLLASLAVSGLGQAAAQVTHQMGPESPTATVAVLTAALYNEGANVREDSDSSRAELATTALRDRLTDQLGDQLAPFALVDSIADLITSRELTGGIPCNVVVSCAREVARRVEAPWVVLAKVSKTSNLIWLFSSQLVRVSTGEIILDDSTELKGDPAIMVPIGARRFADRGARTVRRGGFATNYPEGEPSPTR
jgi:hypothetical protein